ncbi:GNVR domain-containing protein [Oceanicoccus sp. KOV_DT_Chl]|uniref:GumC family protein n=1 Tax=Oceanicoccus sp. KOV_DT_Chl TaxID=1904639 RepID=UPI000C7AA1EF|nr:GNVR domain-containing protein [Oceanicoccus sp. KOV_DT_Chl]
MNMAVEFEEETKGLEEYIGAFKRRKKEFLIPSSVIFFIALFAAMMWPSTYQSSATILIEEQQIPKDLVSSTVTSFAAQQIEVIKARIMTMQNIMGLVDKYNLHTSDELQATARSEIVARFVEDVGLDVLSAGVLDPRTGRPTEATIAFTLSYKHKDPAKAQKVASELVNLYLNENLKDRAEKSSSTSVFLTEEGKTLEAELAALETELAEFKLKNEGSLPELYQYNLQVIERTEREMLDVSLRLKELTKRKLDIESQLVQLSPYAPTVMPDGQQVLSDYDRLKSLKSAYRQKVAVYSEEHPDVIRLAREIEVLEKVLGISLSQEELEEQLRIEKNILSELQQQYTGTHPKVVAQQRVVDDLVLSKSDALEKGEAANSKDNPDNPAYVLMDTQLKSVVVEMQILNENKLELAEKLKRYEDHILKAPMVEKTYIALQRDYANATAKYQEINAKQRAAELGKNLEQGRKGERFTLIDPPALPEEPVSPNRPVIIFLGFIFSVGVGLGTVIVLEALSPAIRGRDALAVIMGAQPLAVVPYMSNDETDGHKASKWYKLIALAIVVISIVMLAFHFLVKPLDVTWFMILRAAGLS